MPVLNWNTSTIDGVEYLVIDVAKLRIPLEWDPNSNVFIAVAAPTGGVMDYPALVQGDPGVTPDIDTTINFVELGATDPTAAYASFTETAPNVYKLNLGLHRGLQGDDGDTVLDPDDFDDPLPGKVIVVNPANTGFDLQYQKVGDWYYPATIVNTPSGNAGYTLCSVGVPAQNTDWRPDVSGQCSITGTGSDVVVDLLARLDNATAGNIVGRAIGSPELSVTTHTHPTHVLSAGAPWSGYTSTYDKVPAGVSATIYLRAERRTGTETFTTSNSNTFFRVRVDPVG